MRLTPLRGSVASGLRAVFSQPIHWITATHKNYDVMRSLERAMYKQLFVYIPLYAQALPIQRAFYMRLRESDP